MAEASTICRSLSRFLRPSRFPLIATNNAEIGLLKTMTRYRISGNRWSVAKCGSSSSANPVRGVLQDLPMTKNSCSSSAWNYCANERDPVAAIRCAQAHPARPDRGVPMKMSAQDRKPSVVWLEQVLSITTRAFYGVVCLLFSSFNALASDMGNGPAAINTWIVGGAIALVVALATSAKKDDEGQHHGFSWTTFMTKLMAYSAVVFLAGIVAFIF